MHRARIGPFFNFLLVHHPDTAKVFLGSGTDGCNELAMDVGIRYHVLCIGCECNNRFSIIMSVPFHTYRAKVRVYVSSFVPLAWWVHIPQEWPSVAWPQTELTCVPLQVRVS